MGRKKGKKNKQMQRVVTKQTCDTDKKLSQKELPKKPKGSQNESNKPIERQIVEPKKKQNIAAISKPLDEMSDDDSSDDSEWSDCCISFSLGEEEETEYEKVKEIEMDKSFYEVSWKNRLKLIDDVIQSFDINKRVEEMIIFSEMSKEDKSKLADELYTEASCCFHDEEFDEAEAYLDFCILLCPSAIAFCRRALIKLKRDDYEGSIEDCTASLEIEKDGMDALFTRGTAYDALFKFEESVNDFEKLLQIDPKCEEALDILKLLYGKYVLQKKYEGIVVKNPYETEEVGLPCTLRLKIEEMPGFLKNRIAHSLRDSALKTFNSGKYYGSWELCNMSIDICPTVAAYNSRAAACLKLRWDKWALDDCNKVIDMEPSNVKGHVLRGRAYNNLYMLNEAMEDIKQVLELKPGNKDVRQLLRDLVWSRIEGNQDEDGDEDDSLKSESEIKLDEEYKSQNDIEEEGSEKEIEIEDPGKERKDTGDRICKCLLCPCLPVSVKLGLTNED